MQLSKAIIHSLNKDLVNLPKDEVFDFPEKILQFGTGVLLRGLPDYFVNKANNQGIFKGRIVVVKSTDMGNADEFTKQDCLYTHCIRGIENGKDRQENIVNASISRVLSAPSQWKEILASAHNPELKIIISNTTEVGIQLQEDDVFANPPHSFPGKLVAFLLERYHAFKGDTGSGMIIIPTELVTNNGSILKSIVLELARRNQLDASFINWLEHSNTFCSSLVDRIVPGKPPPEKKLSVESQVGYTDNLMILSESYCLWAIEGDEKVESVLDFAKADAGVVIASDINKFRELKLRLLNGVHTLCCGPAYLSGFQTVKQAMADPYISAFMEDLMMNEVAPAIPYSISPEETKVFGKKVLDRFRNRHLEHQWLSITLQYSLKMRNRNIPMLLKYFELFKTTPPLFSLGFAGYLFFMKAVRQEGKKYYGEMDGAPYLIQDDKAAYFFQKWKELHEDLLVDTVLTDEELWGTNLSSLPGFANQVKKGLHSIAENGMRATMMELENKLLKDQR